MNEVQALNRNLPAWFQHAKSGQLKLPRFQRFEAWGKHQKVGGNCGSVWARQAEPWCPGLKVSEIEQPNLNHASPECPPLFGAPRCSP